MSKRRRASELIFGRSHVLKYPVTVMSALAGTGTVARGGVLTVIAASGAAITAHTVYLTISAGTNIGTLVGSYSTGF